jgi:hypothetical protein
MIFFSWQIVGASKFHDILSLIILHIGMDTIAVRFL